MLIRICHIILLSIFVLRNFKERKSEKNVFKFHSAEHMIINAYKKLERVPSLEEIREFSRFSNSCGTNVITQIVFSFILMFFCTFIPNIRLMNVAILSVNFVILILLQCGFLNFLQRYTTIVPTDRELLVAISGMNVWLENEKKEKEKFRFKKFLHRLFPKVFI